MGWIRVLGGTALGAMLLTSGCTGDTDGDSSSDDDTDPTDDLPCDEGFVLDADLPAEFAEAFPDGCVPATCGVGPWGDHEIPADAVFVDASVGGGGGGTEGNPFASIQDGLDAVGGSGGTVVVAAGTYGESLSLTGAHDGVALVGRCRDLVVLDASQGEPDDYGIWANGATGEEEWRVEGIAAQGAGLAGVQLDAGRLVIEECALRRNRTSGATVQGWPNVLSLRDVEIVETLAGLEGSLVAGIYVSGWAALEAEDCLIEANTENGIFAIHEGTTVRLDDVVVRETVQNAEGRLGWGVQIVDGASLEFDTGLVEGNAEVGVYAMTSGTDVRLSNVEILDTRPAADGLFGRGVNVHGGASLEACHCRIEGNSDHGIMADGLGTTVRLESVEVMDTQPIADGTFGRGINVQGGASLHAEGCVVDGNMENGVYVGGEGTSVRLSDVEVRSTQPSEASGWCGGASVEDGATLYADDCVFERNVEIGIRALDGGMAHLSNVTVRETQYSADWDAAVGIGAEAGGAIVAEDCQFEGNAVAGIAAVGEGTTVHISGSEVLDTQVAPDGTGGVGVVAQDGALIQIADGLVQGSATYGILAMGEDTVMDVTGTDILDTVPDTHGSYGVGCFAMTGAFLSAEDCAVEGNTRIGVAATGDETVVFLRGVSVSDTLFGANGESGPGIQVQEGAWLQIEDSVIERNASLGAVALHPGTTLHLSGVEVRDTRTHANGTGGRGIEIIDGASLHMTETLVADNAGFGILTEGEGTFAQIEDSEVSATTHATDMTVSVGVACQLDSQITATGLVVDGTEGPGLYSTLGCSLSCSGCDLTASTFAGALVWYGATLEISDSSIVGTRPDSNEGGGVGVFASSMVHGNEPNTLRIENSHIEDQPYAAVWLDGEGVYSFIDNTLVAGYGMEIGFPDGTSTTLHGDGIVATNGVEDLSLENNDIQGAYRAGVLLDGSSALLDGNRASDNDTDLVWQDCEGVQEPLVFGDTLDYDNRCSSSTLMVVPLVFNLFEEVADVAD